MNAHIGIEQVGRRVALESEHPIKAELIVGGAVLTEISIFHGSDANSFCHLGNEILLGLSLLLGHALHQITAGALHRFIQQVPQANGGAGAGFELLAVSTLNQTERHMLEAATRGHPTGPLRHLKHRRKVVRLARIGDIHDTLSSLAACSGAGQPLADSSQVGGGVVVAPIPLLNNERQGLAIFACHALQKHTAGAVVNGQQLSLLQILHNLGKGFVVKRFAPLHQLHIQTVIDGLERLTGLLAEQPPGP